MSTEFPPLHVALLAGCAAGTAADTILYPLDTIKTRLQSPLGLYKSGGFRGIFSGLGPVVLGSAPTAGVFFGIYELTKKVSSSTGLGKRYEAGVHMLGASLGETAACLIRVPVEVVKQRAQASPATSMSIFRSVLREEGPRGLYRGFFSTVMRDVPFSFIQFPLWELLKSRWGSWQGAPVDAWQSAICGAVAGGVTAAVTTPLDVAKTRIMLAERESATAKGNIPSVLRNIFATRGVRGLFVGIVPRVLWVSIGGAIFLGIYDKAVTLHTDIGDIKLELFCEQVPKACENFLALCASGYYDNTLIHRNIKGFMVQMGDPTGTGKGGSSIWGRKFEDELIDNLKHNIRGVVSMANNGPDTNGSQFFITYAKQPHLDMKYTIFAKVIDGLESLDDLEKLPVNEKTFRLLADKRINSITIHANPVAEAAS